MSKVEVELERCPFCGSEKALRVTHKKRWNMNDEHVYDGIVSCKNCDIVLQTVEGYGGWLDAENAAVEIWNRMI